MTKVFTSRDAHVRAAAFAVEFRAEGRKDPYADYTVAQMYEALSHYTLTRDIGARDYFWKVVDAQLTFEVDAEGRVTQAVLHQNGGNPLLKRID
jgi:hypothetical protein